MAQLAGRYKLESVLGAGTYGTTHLARDGHKPSQPYCVVKRLRQHAPKILNLFEQEAIVLERLGRHPQIPELIAYFSEADQFYIVQEYIDGHSLRREILPQQQLGETYVAKLLHDVLIVLSFVHRHQVIHRDIKPENLMRRRTDGCIFLIDFGAVKQLSNSDIDGRGKLRTTVTVGTSGYMPVEQRKGNPCLSSDLYALGIVAIEALTGVSPRRLELDPDTLETNWRQYATGVDPSLLDFLDRLTRWHAQQRIPSAQEALAELESLPLTPGTVLQEATDAGERLAPPEESHYQTAPERPKEGSLIHTENRVASLDPQPPPLPIPAVIEAPTNRRPVAAPTEPAATDVVSPAYRDDTMIPPAINPRRLPIKSATIGVAMGLGLLVAWGMGLKAVEYWERWQNSPVAVSPAQSRYPEATADQLVCLYRDCQPGDRLRPAAFDAFWRMWAAAREEGVQLKALKGFQTIEAQRIALTDLPESQRQKQLYHSDYHTGYGVAIGDGQSPESNEEKAFDRTAAFRWLQENAATFGFELARPKRSRQLPYEPWRWRYVGNAESRALFDEGD